MTKKRISKDHFGGLFSGTKGTATTTQDATQDARTRKTTAPRAKSARQPAPPAPEADPAPVTAPAVQQGAAATGKGRPRTHDELVRVTTVLERSQQRFLDRLASDLRLRGKTDASAAAILRELVRQLESGTVKLPW